MLKRIKAWLDGADGGTGGARGPDRTMQVAAAALLIEAARQDGSISADELEAIRGLLAARFDLSAHQAAALVEDGEAAQAKAAGLFRFTRASVETMDEEQRERLVEMMWDVVYADGVVHDFETNLMRRVCGLLHVSDRASGLARKRVQSRRSARTE